MTENPLFKKLALKPGKCLLVLNAPPEFLPGLGQPPEGITLVSQAQGHHDAVLLFVKDRADFHARIQDSLAPLEYDGLFWLAYPKKTGQIPSDLARDDFWKLMESTGLRPVMQIALDDTWSALRFRPAELVNKK